MPKSKKRVSKPKDEVQVAVRNPLHTTTGKVVVVLLAGGFVIGVLASLIAILVDYVN